MIVGVLRIELAGIVQALLLLDCADSTALEYCRALLLLSIVGLYCSWVLCGLGIVQALEFLSIVFPVSFKSLE